MDRPFPPILETYMPVFTGNEAKVYFTLSQYDTIADIQCIQVVVNNQKTNQSMLNNSNEMLIVDWDTNVQEEIDEDRFFITISADWLKNETFEMGQYYKVQLRLVSKDAAEPPAGANDNASVKEVQKWLVENAQYFSEWSTVCLIRKVYIKEDKPNGIINGIHMNIPVLNSNDDTSKYGFATPLISYVGGMEFEEGETETLGKYRIIIKNSKQDIVDDSSWIEANQYDNSNSIYYKSKTRLENGEYTLRVEYYTRNNYTNKDNKDTVYTRTFFVEQASGLLQFKSQAFSEPEWARNKIKITATTSSPAADSWITILRSDLLSNFSQWEEIMVGEVKLEDDPTEADNGKSFVWYDYSIESNLPYKYIIQEADCLGIRGSAEDAAEKEIIITELESGYLNCEGRQLKLILDENISSYRFNVAEGKVDTIGSQYPFVTRNANMNYRTFSLSGTISILTEGQIEYNIQNDNICLDASSNIGLFTKLTELLIQPEQFDTFNTQNRINEYNNIYLERKYRELVMQFLMSPNVKLFRSPTEGNILVRLTDVSFSPNQTLGRHIYGFSCTVIEIAECNIENLDKYKIQIIGTEKPPKQVGYQTKENSVIGLYDMEDN